MLYAFLIPLLPTIFWLVYFYRRDNIEKEPKRLIFYSVFLGAISTFFVAIAEAYVLTRSGLRIYLASASFGGLIAMMAVGFVEEVAKFLTLRFTFYRSKFFNEVSDGIIYGVGIGLGFAFAENIFYALTLGFEVSIYRALSTPIFHAAAAALSGYFLARSAFGRKGLGYLGVILASLVHGFSNYLLIATSFFRSYLFLFAVITLDLSLIIWVLLLYRTAVKEPPLPRKKLKTHPLLAAALNIVPGFGFLYLNRWQAGLNITTLTIFLYTATQYAMFSELDSWPLLALFSAFAIFFLFIFSFFYTYLLARGEVKIADQQKETDLRPKL